MGNVKKRLIGWIPAAYLGSVLISFFPFFAWGPLGLIRPGTIQDGKINADYAIALIVKFSGQVKILYFLLFIGFIITIVVKRKLSKIEDNV